MGKDLKGKELGVGISQQKDGFYSARFVDKFRNRKQKRFKKLQDCRQWLADAIYFDEHSDMNNPTDMMVDTWYDYWIDVKKKTVKYRTLQNYITSYDKHIKPVIGEMLLKNVKSINCQQIFSNMTQRGLKTSTIQLTRTTLYSLFETAKDNDLITANPCKKSVKCAGKSSEKKEALTIETQKIFLEAIKGRSYENQYRLILQTGLRVGELIGLKWEDVDFEKRTLKIERSVGHQWVKNGKRKWMVGEPKTKSGYRTIPLTDEAIRILKNQKEKDLKIKVVQMEWMDYIFINSNGNLIDSNTYDKVLYKICDSVKIERFSIHILRHTFATRCIEGGMKPKTLQKILGHSNIGITMNLYVHTTEEEKQKEMDMVADVLKAI